MAVAKIELRQTGEQSVPNYLGDECSFDELMMERSRERSHGIVERKRKVGKKNEMLDPPGIFKM